MSQETGLIDILLGGSLPHTSSLEDAEAVVQPAIQLGKVCTTAWPHGVLPGHLWAYRW